MKKRETRNKFRDMMADYYKTNREIGKKDEEAYKDQEKPKGLKQLSGTEKIYITVIILGLIGIVIKYVIL